MRTTTSNCLFKIGATTALVGAATALALGPVAVATYNVGTAAILVAYNAKKVRTSNESRIVVAIELVIAATALMGPLAYVGFVPNTLLAAFLTWFAWRFKMTKLW